MLQVFGLPPPTAMLKENLLGLLACFGLLGALDLAVCRRSRARWMFIHAVANAVVCFYSFDDLLTALDNPQQSCVGRQSSDVPTCMIVALHIYHLAFFECRADDIFHHLVFVSSLGGVGLYVDGGALLSLVAFFMCGLPGGLDYAMLVAVKHDMLSPLAEKAWNSRINVWIRSPGLMLAAFLLYQATRHGPAGSTCAQQPWGAALVALLCVVNGQYYMQRVTGNAYRKNEVFSS